MYEETYGKSIEQIVILLASEDGSVQNFIKEKKDYMDPLMKSIDEFYKYYQEQNKDKIKDKSKSPHFIKEGSDEKNNFNTHYKSVFSCAITSRRKRFTRLLTRFMVGEHIHLFVLVINLYGIMLNQKIYNH